MASLSSHANILPQNNFVQRALMCAIMLPLFLAAIWYTDRIFQFILWSIALLGAREWLRMTQGKILSARGYIFLTGIVLIAVINSVQGSHVAWLFIALWAVILKLTHLLYSNKDTAWYVGGFLYLTVPTLSLLAMFDNNTIGRAIITYFFAIIWAADIGAYLIGRQIGGAKLAPGISPKKTWSGFLGGIITSVLTGALIFWYFHHPLIETISAALIAFVVSVAAQMSDLLESWIKRVHNVKDSGTMIMGHGGVLDRVDSLILAAPLLALIQYCAGHPLPW